jgi:hypothetical protein
MKSSLKISALALAFAAFAFSAKAQTSTTTSTTTTTPTGVRYSIGVDAGLPIGNFKSGYNWNIGGSLQADIPVVSNQLFVTVNAGYDNFFGKKDVIAFTSPAGGAGTTVSVPNIQLLPVKAGLKFFPVSNFYIQGDAGVAFLLNKSNVGFDKSAAFVWAPQVGYQFQLGGGNYIDAGVRYESTSNFVTDENDSKVKFIGLRVAYGF